MTKGLRLEPVRLEMAPVFFGVIKASQPEFSRWFVWAGEPRLDASQAYAAESEAGWESGTSFNFAIYLGDELIGNISLRVDRRFPELASLSYWMGTAWQGQGYTSEAAEAVRDLGFDQAGLARQELVAGVENLASQRVAEKMGMRREGLMRSAAWSGGGEPYDAYLYAMLRDDARRDTGERYEGDRPQPVLTEPDFARAREVSSGLVTAVVQDAGVGDVLMVAHMNDEAYRRTLETGRAWFWSRSRQKLWEKGETSADYLDVSSITLDCDGDAVLLQVSPHGPACHTGARTCFHNPAK